MIGGVSSFVSETAWWAAFAVSFLVAAALLLSRRAGWLWWERKLRAPAHPDAQPDPPLVH